MRCVTLLGICAIVFLAFATGGTHSKPAKEISLIRNENEARENKSDWLLDLIFDLLGITGEEFLSTIFTALSNMDLLVKGAIKELQSILSLLNPDAKEEIERIISVSMKEVSDFMEPLVEQLREVLINISSEQSTKMTVTDTILALLGITLEEFLTNITSASVGVNSLVRSSITELNTLAEGLDGEAKATVADVIENKFIEGLNVFLGPTLEKLRKLFPEE